MRRAGMHTVAEILVAGKPRLSAVKQIGTLTTNRIFTAVANYLGLTEDQLADATGSPPGTCWDPRKSPIGALPITPSTLHALKRMGFFEISQLIQSRTTDYGNLPELNRKEIDEVDQALTGFLSRAARARLLRWNGMEDLRDDALSEPPSIPFPVLSLPLPRLGEGAWSTLEWRAMQLLSPKEIGTRVGGISGQRVYRIIQQAHADIRQNMNRLSVFLDYFEEKASRLHENLGTGPLELETLIDHLLPDPAVSDLILHEQDVERTIVLLRSLVLYHHLQLLDEMKGRWPTLLLLSCLVEPALAGHEPVRQILGEREAEKRTIASGGDHRPCITTEPGQGRLAGPVIDSPHSH